MVAFATFALWSCGFFESAHKTSDEIHKTFKTINSAGKDLHDISSAASDGAVSGAVKALSKDSAKLKEIASEILKSIKSQAGGIVASIRDSVLNKKTSKWLKESLHNVSDSTRMAIIRITGDPRLTQNAKKIIGGIRDEILGEATVKKAGVLRDSLMGAKTRALTDSLIHHAMMRLNRDLDLFQPKIYVLLDSVAQKIERVRQHADDSIKKFKVAAWGLGILLVVALLVAYLIKRQANKHLQAIKAMATAVDALPQDEYDNISQAIKNETMKKGVLSHLDGILQSIKLPNKELYKDPSGQALAALLGRLSSDSPELKALYNDPDTHESVKDFFRKKTK